MRIGFVGLGKLGLPVATAIASYGHEVMGYDVNPARMSKLGFGDQEAGPDGRGSFLPHLRSSDRLSFAERLEEVLDFGEIIFVAVQTPHEPRFEGTQPLPTERADFDYSHLRACMAEISALLKTTKIVVVISTVLPGTMRREVELVINSKVLLAYNPFFIAMGTTMRDFLNPEFVLIGARSQQVVNRLASFYESITSAPILPMSIESAELAKVAYNTFISAKIGIVNILMEICHATPGANIDQVTRALKSATRRVTGPYYMDGGMGDGGGCHPRDNIAMSWLSDQLGVSFNIFDSIMKAREENARWIARMLFEKSHRHALPVIILGEAFKSGTRIVTGSPSVLVKNILETEFRWPVAIYDPHTRPEAGLPTATGVYLIGTKHDDFRNFRFPQGSIVLDPWRYIPKQEGVILIPLGVGQ